MGSVPNRGHNLCKSPETRLRGRGQQDLTCKRCRKSAVVTGEAMGSHGGRVSREGAWSELFVNPAPPPRPPPPLSSMGNRSCQGQECSGRRLVRGCNRVWEDDTEARTRVRLWGKVGRFQTWFEAQVDMESWSGVTDIPCPQTLPTMCARDASAQLVKELPVNPSCGGTL